MDGAEGGLPPRQGLPAAPGGCFKPGGTSCRIRAGFWLKIKKRNATGGNRCVAGCVPFGFPREGGILRAGVPFGISYYS